MKLLVLSDLHIGADDSFNTFGWNIQNFVECLELVIEKENIDKVIFNGDTFELYKYTWKEIEKSRKELINYFKNSKFIFIRGNHDAILPFGLNSYELTNSNNQLFLIEHGHAADFISGFSIGRKIQTFSFYLLRKLVKFKPIQKIYFNIVEASDYNIKIPKKYNTWKYLKYALRKLLKVDILILGHTHKLEVHKVFYLQSKKIYINTGTCQLGKFQAVIIDTETLKYDTLKFKSHKQLLAEYA